MARLETKINVTKSEQVIPGQRHEGPDGKQAPIQLQVGGSCFQPQLLSGYPGRRLFHVNSSNCTADPGSQLTFVAKLEIISLEIIGDWNMREDKAQVLQVWRRACPC
jgi:hypothetical protein